MVFSCNHNNQGCGSRFILLKDGSGKLLKEHKVDFIHQVDCQIEQRYLFKQFASHRLEMNPDIEPSRIILEYVNREDYSINSSTPEVQYMIQKINKIKAKKYGKIPKTVEDIKVEDLKKYSKSFEFHFIEYVDKGKKYKALVIYNDFQKKLMKKPGVRIMGDGTFDTSPKIYTQLYTIHLLIESASFPVCFVLSVNRVTSMYESVFKHLKEEIGLRPVMMMTDFEQSARNGFASVYPNVLLKGCYFHFCQAIIKNVKDLKLGSSYNNDIDINMIVKYLMNLPFIEPKEMKEYFKVIEEEVKKVKDDKERGKLEELLKYFNRTWMDGTFKLKDWNQLKDLSRRTNNWSESFHSAFSRKFNSSHPNIFKLISVLNDTITLYQNDYNDF